VLVTAELSAKFKLISCIAPGELEIGKQMNVYSSFRIV